MNYKNSSDTDSTSTFALFGLVVGVPAVMFLVVLWTTFWTALAGWQMWQWFALPLGAPDINGFHIAGLLMLAHLGLPRPKEPEDKDMGEWGSIALTLAKSPIISAAMVFAGFVVAKLAGLI